MLQHPNLSFVIILFHFHLKIASAFNLTNGVDAETRLLDKLKSSIPQYSPPADFKDKTVFIYLDLYQLLDVDEKNGLMTAKLWLYYYYYSDSAKWDPSEYGNIQALLVPPLTFWTADIVALDAVDIQYEAFDRQALFPITGLISCWSSFVTIKVSCSFDVTNFPFDTHACNLTFGPWNLDNRSYVIATDPYLNMKEADLAHYKEHDEWTLLRPVKITTSGRSMRNIRSFDVLTVELRLERRHLFYAIIFVMPNLLLYYMSSFVFILPVESGEKVSFSITILLAEIVSFGSISDILPASSLNFPSMGYFVCAAVIQTALSSLLAIMVINIHYTRGKHKMSRRLRSLISSKYMYIFALSPCAEEKAFPGLAAHSMSRANIAKVRSEGGNNNQQREEFEFKDTSSVATEEKEKIECPRTQSIWSKLARESIRITPITHNGDESANGQNKSADSEIKVPRNVDFPEKLKLRTLVENVQLLESEENMEFLWKYFAQLVDRVCLYFYVVITMFISIDFIKYL